jgi:hypothetical protein
MTDETLMLDPLPTALQAAVENNTRLLANQEGDLSRLQAVVETLLRWDAGDTVTVAFQGGTTDLHKTIADAALEWTKHGNVSLDFGQTTDGTFRTWSPSDTRYAADIRIGFDRIFQPGYWSLVGRHSIEPNIVAFGAASMNFGGFDVRLPQDFATTVLHEFGHALGFHHEHASPVGGCDNEFRWNDDPGYQRTVDPSGGFIPDASGRRPGIYTVLAGPPNRWPKAKVDANLRQLPPSSAFQVSAFDVKSIMKYHFPEWMFTRGKNSVCYSEENLLLSAGDIGGIQRAYPFLDSELRDRARQSHRVLTAAVESNPNLERAALRERLERLAGTVRGKARTSSYGESERRE